MDLSTPGGFKRIYGVICVLLTWEHFKAVIAQDCVNPPAIGNGYIVSADPYKDGSRIVYTCQEGYNMEGQADGVTCSSGKWTGEKPICTTNESKTLSIQMWILIAIGIALGILLLIGLILLCVYCCCKRQSAYVGPGGIFGTYNVVKDQNTTPVQRIEPKKQPTKPAKKKPPPRNATVFGVDDMLMRNEVISRAVEKVKQKAKCKQPTAATSPDGKKPEAFFIPVNEVNKSPRSWVSKSVTPRSGMGKETNKTTPRRNNHSPDSDAGYSSSQFNSPAPQTPPYRRVATSLTIQEFLNRRRNPQPPQRPPWLPHTHGVRNINTITR